MSGILNLGARAHDFGKLPLASLATAIEAAGFYCAQLAPSKAIADFDCGDGKLNPGLAALIGKAFRSRGIQIAVVGCYINPIHPDIAERKRQLERFKEHLRHARDMGCDLVATETGSFNADGSFNPDNHGERGFKAFMESLGELLEEAERFGVCVGIEGVTHNPINTPAKIRRMLDEAGSSNLQVVFDPVNLLNAENYERRLSIIDESFDLFGDRIAAFHAKDFAVNDGKMRLVQVGKGLMEYPRIVTLLETRKPFLSFLVEGIDLGTKDETLEYLRGLSGA